MISKLFMCPPQRLGKSRAKPLLTAVVIFFMLSATARAQFVTKNAYVEADVSKEGEGLITIYLSNPSGHTNVLSYGDKSYLTVVVDGKFYTNNTNLPLLPALGPIPVAPSAYLQNGATKVIKGSIPGQNDIIRTTWQPQGAGAFDIVQDVYPVASANAGQIVYKFSIVNHENKGLNVQAQLLLDAELASPGITNDNPPLTTRFGYTQNWFSFSNTIAPGIPPYFMVTQQTVCAHNFPGLMGMGFNNDSLAPVPMGLMQPSLFAFVDWPTIVSLQGPNTGFTWGFPPSPVSNVADQALLIQWPGTGVSPNSTQEIGRGSYGIPGCAPISSGFTQLCYGNLDALIIHPDHIIWNPAPQNFYSPNHFPVDVVVWNTNGSANASSAKATQTITSSSPPFAQFGPVRIVSPTPIGPGGYTQQHNLFGAAVLSCGSSSATWEDTVYDHVLVNCSTDSSYDITVTLSAGGVGNTNFITGPCSCPIIVDCEQKDLTPPRHTPHIFSGSNHCGTPTTCKDSVYDNLPTDQGIQSIKWTVTPNPNSIAVTGVPATITGCPPVIGPITMTQVDTLHAPCVYFTFTDCAGNVSYDTICFSACRPPIPYDTLPPKFWLQRKYGWNIPTDSTCGFDSSDWVVTDTVIDIPGDQHDRGLRSITVDTATVVNMRLTPAQPVTVVGMKQAAFTVSVIDSMKAGYIVIRATDTVKPFGNYALDTIYYCPNPDTRKPSISTGSLNSGKWTVRVTDSMAWDRGIDSVVLTSVLNCYPIANSNIIIRLDSADSSTWTVRNTTKCIDTFSFQMAIIDTFKQACFTAQAWDCAGNVSIIQTACAPPLIDSFCPSWDTTSLGLPPGQLLVTISDYHLKNGDTVTFDEGIDSIWFTCANNITLVDSAGNTWTSSGSTLHSLHGTPTGSDHPKFQKKIQFTLKVTDPTSQDPNPTCVCFNAMDGAGNPLCQPHPGPIQWCYPVIQDVNPPKLTVTNPACNTLALVVTDSQFNDRGIYSVWLDSITNFVSLMDTTVGVVRTLPLTLPIPDTNASSYARLSSLDVYGEFGDAAAKQAHTTKTDVWIYKQDLAMNGSGIASAGANFKVPVYLVATDTIPLAQKQITQYQFSFHVTGTPLVNFVGTQLPTKMTPAGWTVVPAPGAVPPGPPYLITGQGPVLTNVASTDTFVYLLFTAAKSTDVELAQIVIDPDPCGAGVFYNGGNPQTITGASSTVTLPAPSGRLNGGTIILRDSCTTIVGDNPHPTILSLAPSTPNPTTSSAESRAIRLDYTVPSEAPVALELYNELGQKVRTVVAEIQKQGEYHRTLDASNLPEGTYFLRLASGGKVVSRRIMLTH